MKRISITFAIAVFAVKLLGQNTTLTLSYPDKSPASEISVFSDEIFLGNSNLNGIIEIPKSNLPSNKIVFKQFGNQLLFSVTDSTISGTNAQFTIILFPPKMEEILIMSSRNQNDKNTTAQQLLPQNLGRDLPMLLQFAPSVQVSSDAGNGIGYTGIKIRGSDASRTNVTINGVPINDAESHSTYWVNMPDLTSSAASIQIQNGAGSSTNGSGAFGASVNIQTASSDKAYGRFSTSIGSYNTLKSNIAGGTGLINNHWTAEFRISKIKSDGYIDRAATDLSSYFLNLSYKNKNWEFKFLQFGGTEKTYQAWYGAPIERLTDENNIALKNQYERNLGFIYKNQMDSSNLFSSNRTYNYYTYKNETDNYTQNHIHAYINYKINANSYLNSTLFTTLGKGYFEQFRYQDKISNYGFPNFILGTDTIQYSDVIRRRWLDNKLIGLNSNYFLQKNKTNLKLGISVSRYLGKHFGELVWAQFIPSASHLQHYYNATGNKTDASAYAKANHYLNKKTNVWLDLQIRHVNHDGMGNDNDLRTISFNRKHLFFNPKIGFLYSINRHQQILASAAVAQKEPTRSDITDNNYGSPKPEKLMDYELTYRLYYKKVSMNLTGYVMNYKNQLVLTGAINDVGNPLRTNVDKSYRRGIESSINYEPFKNFIVGGNFTFSANRIKQISVIVPNYVTYINDTLNYSNTKIALSPNLISAVYVNYTYKNWYFQFNVKYCGSQQLDNTSSSTRKIEAYSFGELTINKTLVLRNESKIRFQFQVLNAFNTRYHNNGYTYYYTSGTVSVPQLIQEVYVFPQALRNYLAGIVFDF